MDIIDALKLAGTITDDHARKLKDLVIDERKAGYTAGFEDCVNLIGSRIFMNPDRNTVQILRDKMLEDD